MSQDGRARSRYKGHLFLADIAMKLLIVEDEPKTGRSLQQGLGEAGFAVDLSADGATGERLALEGGYDLLILDVMLPGRDGWQILHGLRRAGLKTPVLFLTARDAVEDRVHGLELGADDYLVKPFDVAELKARLRALLRRSFNRPQPALEYRGVHLDPQSQAVSYQGREVTLARKEFLLLHELLAQPGRVLTRDRLQQALYGWDEEVESNALEVHVHHLRRKIFPELIRTVRGVGYMVDKS